MPLEQSIQILLSGDTTITGNEAGDNGGGIAVQCERYDR